MFVSQTVSMFALITSRAFAEPVENEAGAFVAVYFKLSIR